MTSARQKRYRARHPERVRKYQQEYRERNRARRADSAKRHRAANPESYRRSSKKYREKNRDVINERRSRTRLIGGLITAAQYDDLLARQRGGCAICHETPSVKPSPGHTRRRSLWVDHDHETKRVRGLLCHHCNVALGYFKDRVDLLEAAITYLATQQGERR